MVTHMRDFDALEVELRKYERDRIQGISDGPAGRGFIPWHMQCWPP